MASSITLNELRTQYQDEIETDPETGIRYTVDSLGNSLIFAPTREIPSETPGAPSGFEYESLAPESKTFTDPSGKEVTMTETDIRPYLFDPTLIQRESDLALLSGKAGPDVPPVGTELKRGKEWEGRPGEKKTFVEPETGATKLMPGVEPADERDLPEEEKQKIQAASQRIDQGAGVTPPGGPELPETGDIDWFDPKLRDNYVAHIEQKMGGNPNTINPQEEVMKLMPDSKVQSWYSDNWVDGMPTWFDLSKSAQAQVGTKLRSDLLSEYKRELAAKAEVYNQLMAEFDKKQKAHQKAIKDIRAMVQSQLGQQKSLRKEAATEQRSANTLKRDILKFTKERDETFDEARKKQLDEHVKDLKGQLEKMEGKEKPISTEKQTGAKPGWAPANAMAWVETAKGKFYKVIEDGKEVTYPAKEAK